MPRNLIYDDKEYLSTFQPELGIVGVSTFNSDTFN